MLAGQNKASQTSCFSSTIACSAGRICRAGLFVDRLLLPVSWYGKPGEDILGRRVPVVEGAHLRLDTGRNWKGAAVMYSVVDGSRVLSLSDVS